MKQLDKEEAYKKIIEELVKKDFNRFIYKHKNKELIDALAKK